MSHIANRKQPLPSDGSINELLRPYQVALDNSQLAAVRRYMEVLLLWNQKINLTSLREPAVILQRHFGESFFAAAVVPITVGRLADVGSGAGFPGLALKIACPELQVTLIERNTKKAAFLYEVAMNLQLTDVRVARHRFEELNHEPLDFVTMRAVGDFARVLRWAQRTLAANGRLVLWLRAEDARELRKTKAWKWFAPVLIPGSKRRVILSGQLEPS